MSSNDWQLLIDSAVAARGRAYAPYSHFAVGAALMADDGEIFLGCNVENVSYGMTICAERAAVCSAIVAGQQKFRALAVATAGGHAPCGACRQVLAEFNDKLAVLLVDVNHPDSVTQYSLASLLPDRFGPAG